MTSPQTDAVVLTISNRSRGVVVIPSEKCDLPHTVIIKRVTLKLELGFGSIPEEPVSFSLAARILRCLFIPSVRCNEIYMPVLA